MTKDGKASVRYSTEILNALKKQGWSVQSLLDWAIKQMVTVETKVKLKK